LQCVAVRCSALQCVAVRCSALQCVAVRCSALQCVAVLILHAVLIAPFFVCWFSSSQGIYCTSQTHKDFQRSEESHFRSKIPVTLVLNFGIGANPSVPWDVLLFDHWKRCENFDHMRPRLFERPCRNVAVMWFSPGPSFACLFRALQAPCGVASNS